MASKQDKEIDKLLEQLRQEECYEAYKSGKTRRFDIPPNKRHKSKKDYRRKDKWEDEDDY